MIKITNSPGSITISGHAGHAPPGQDIVCSAISTLTQTFIASVEELTDCRIRSDLRLGNAVIEYEDLTGDAQLLIESFFIGAEGVASAYPEYVSISREARPSIDDAKSDGR